MSSSHQEPALTQRYWVVGGKYETLEFNRLVHGTESIFGPFEARKDAESAWRRVTENTRSQAAVRYTIAAEPTSISPTS
jgi:hypothetical protein